jgi:hypothetical protein
MVAALDPSACVMSNEGQAGPARMFSDLRLLADLPAEQAHVAENWVDAAGSTLLCSLCLLAKARKVRLNACSIVI